MQQGIPAFDLKSLLPPFHEHTLPSNGQTDLYDSKVHVRALTVRELKHLTSSGRMDKKVFDNCLASCIQEKLDISKLYIQDYNYLVYLIRLYTSGNMANGAKACSSCGKAFNFQYNLSDAAEIVNLDEPMPPVTSVTLDRFKEQTGYEVVCDVKPLTRGDYRKIDDNIRQSQDLAAKLNQPVQVFPLMELLRVQVTQVSGFPAPVPKDQFLDYLQAEEVEKISSVYPDDKFGLKGCVNVNCPICGASQQYDVPFTNLFFS